MDYREGQTATCDECGSTIVKRFVGWTHRDEAVYCCRHCDAFTKTPADAPLPKNYCSACGKSNTLDISHRTEPREGTVV